MKIFITGKNGFVGKNLIEYYNNTKNTIKGYSHKKLLDGNFDELHLHNELDNFQPDVIVNCAALVKETDKKKLYNSNVEFLQSLLDYIILNKEIKFIQIGSTKEDNQPTDNYIVTKQISSILCKHYSYAHNINSIICKAPVLYGKYDHNKSFINLLLKAFKQNEPLVVKNDYNDFLHVLDFVEGIDKLVHYKNFDKGEVVHFITGDVISNLDLVKEFMVLTNNTKPPITKSIENYYNNKNIINTKEAYVKYKWQPKINLSDGIKLLLNSYDEQTK